MTWDPSVLAALDDEAGTLIVVRVTTARGVGLLSDSPASILATGEQVYPWISRWGQLAYSVSSHVGSLEGVAFDFDVRDLEREFFALLGDLTGATCEVLLHTDRTAWADAPLLFSGVIVTAPWAAGVVKVRARVRDDALEVPIPRAELNRYTAPNLPDDSSATTQAQPLVLGVHSAAGYAGDRGMLPAPLFDRLAFRYELGLGRVRADALYSAGVRKTEGTDWTHVEAIGRDLRLATFAEFTTDQADAEVSWDGRGLTDDGQVTGVVVEAPGAALALLMALAVFGDWRRGAYPAGAPLSAPHLAALDAFLAALGHRASYYAGGERRTGNVALAQFLQTFDVRALWTAAGLLAVAPLDHRTQGDAIYRGPGAPDSSYRSDLVLYADVMSDEPEPDFDYAAITQQARVKLGHSAKTGKFHHERVVKVGELGEERTVEGYWSPASALSGEYTVELEPDSTETADYSLSGGATFHECVQTADDGKHGRTVNAAAANSWFRVGFFACPEFVTIKWVEVEILVRSEDGIQGAAADDEFQLGLRTASTDYPSAGAFSTGNAQIVDMPGPWQRLRYRWENPPDAPTTAWTTTKVDAYGAIGRYKPRGDRIQIDQVLLRVSGYPAAAAFAPAALDVGSRIVWRHATPYERLQARGLPLRFASLELLERLTVAWPRRGWRDLWWSREPFVVVGRAWNLEQRTVDLTLEPVRGYLTTFALDARATVDALPYAIPLGIMLVTAGAELETAGGPTVVESPAASDPEAGPLVRTLLNSWPSGRRGLACHGARANLLPDPCFQRGTTGWTITNGANGAAITADASLDRQLYADAADAGNVLALLAGTPHTSEGKAASTATASLDAESVIVVQIWHWDLGAGASDTLAWRLQRSADSRWWAATEWAADPYDNPLPLAAQWTRFASPAINVGGSATTLTLTLVQPSGGTDAHESLVGVAQIDDKPWPGPPIPGAATPESIVARTLSFANDCADGVTTHPPKRFTWTAVVRPWWSAVEITDAGLAEVAVGAEFYAWRVKYDASNEWSLAYVLGAGWRARARHAATNYDAVVEGVAGPPTRFAEIKVEVSATSADGEFDAPLLLMIRVTDASGSVGASVAYVAPTYAAGAKLYVGSDGATGQFEGDIVSLVNSPFATDLR